MASQQYQQILAAIRAQPRFADQTLEQVRVGVNVMSAGLSLPAETQRRPADARGVPCEWLTPRGVDESRVMYYLHGGGYVMGSSESHRGLATWLARAAGTRALIVDYRLGPEHPFPAAVDDVVTAYRWLLDQEVDPSRIVIAGDSAGGGLTAATLVALRDAREPLPAGAVLLSAWLNLACDSRSMVSKADEDPILSREGLRSWAAYYLNGADPRSPLASPVNANLAGLPPLLLQVGTAEVLLDDSVTFAERAQAAGVDVTLEQWDDMVHNWHAMAFLVPEAQQAVERVGEWVRARLG